MRNNRECSWMILLLLMEYTLSEDSCKIVPLLGQLSFGSFLPRSTFTTKYQISIYQCATECQLRKQRCKSFNYRRSALSCQLCEDDSGPGGINLQAKAGTDHSNIDTWRNIPVRNCSERNCSWTEICDLSNVDPQNTCVKTECPFAVLKPGVTIHPSNETAVGTKARYRCVSEDMERGSHLTTCLASTAEWYPTDFKCVCTVPAKSGVIHLTEEVEIGQNYTYRCEINLFKKGDGNPTVTCLHDGSWTSTNFICVTQNWTLDTFYPNNIHKSEVISNHTEIHLLTCMQKCDKEPNNCLSFFYDNKTGLCVLSSSFQRGLPNGFNFSDGLFYYTGKYYNMVIHTF
ncbi:hypothetical protein ACJMK2_002123 [Sinanodonta woodiana]|uniref:Sushi domain-containing protein n=1 Tax=Sinanodonta woodiana TaxID=1069815 RepID=A0ABD3XXK9_SINWO